jgi:autotransporter-associated beta strand protein
VSVVKDGAGTWVLGGEQSFRGSLEVRNGKLIVRRPETYTWHRWTITSKEGTGGSANSYYQMQEFAVFDAEGYRQNFGLSLNSDYASLRPSEVAYGTDKNPVVNGDGVNLDCLFDDIKSKDGSNGWNGTMRAPNMTTGVQTPVRTDPTSWIPIVMRLPAEAKAIGSRMICPGSPDVRMVDG